MRNRFNCLFLLFLAHSIVACVSADSDIVTSGDNIQPGTQVLAAGKPTPLYQGSLTIGENFLERAKGLDFAKTGKVTVISIVPSIDTQVCEAQVHVLGETSALHPNITRAVISRDLPQAQKRFARDSGLSNLTYYSDYKEGAFGRSTGLMMQGPELLTRGVLVLDSLGTLRYMQLVSRIDQLPDMQKAFDFANKLVE